MQQGDFVVLARLGAANTVSLVGVDLRKTGQAGGVSGHCAPPASPSGTEALRVPLLPPRVQLGPLESGVELGRGGLRGLRTTGCMGPVKGMRES